MNDEMLEMMKFYEFYKKIKEMQKNDDISAINNKITEFALKTEGANFLEQTTEKIKPKSQTKTKKKNYKATRVLDKEEYETIINLCKNGFSYEDKKTNKVKIFRANPKLAFALALQATLGFRASDIVNLKVSDFSRNKFSIKEKKTNKWQHRELNDNMYSKILEFAIENNLAKDDFIYPNKIRNMQQQLKIISDYLGYKNIGTHSFRKLFAHTLYEESNYDIELVRHVLNHSDIKTTVIYLGVSAKKVKEVTTKIDFSYIL